MDAFVVQYPNGNPVINYGVTSIVIGDCGASCAPVPPKPEPRQVLVQYLRRVLDKYVDDKDWRWNTFGDYLNYLEGKVALNVLPLMPHSPVRLTVMGEAAYPGGESEELDAMKMVRRRHGVPRYCHQPARRSGDSRRHAEHLRRARRDH
jgi:N-acyl-D-aspartate/D-glutamate deacylase